MTHHGIGMNNVDGAHQLLNRTLDQLDSRVAPQKTTTRETPLLSRQHFHLQNYGSIQHARLISSHSTEEPAAAVALACAGIQMEDDDNDEVIDAQAQAEEAYDAESRVEALRVMAEHKASQVTAVGARTRIDSSPSPSRTSPPTPQSMPVSDSPNMAVADIDNSGGDGDSEDEAGTVLRILIRPEEEEDDTSSGDEIASRARAAKAAAIAASAAACDSALAEAESARCIEEAVPLGVVLTPSASKPVGEASAGAPGRFSRAGKKAAGFWRGRGL